MTPHKTFKHSFLRYHAKKNFKWTDTTTRRTTTTPQCKVFSPGIQCKKKTEKKNTLTNKQAELFTFLITVQLFTK